MWRAVVWVNVTNSRPVRRGLNSPGISLWEGLIRRGCAAQHLRFRRAWRGRAGIARARRRGLLAKFGGRGGVRTGSVAASAGIQSRGARGVRDKCERPRGRTHLPYCGLWPRARGAPRGSGKRAFVIFRFDSCIFNPKGAQKAHVQIESHEHIHDTPAGQGTTTRAAGEK